MSHRPWDIYFPFVLYRHFVFHDSKIFFKLPKIDFPSIDLLNIDHYEGFMGQGMINKMGHFCPICPLEPQFLWVCRNRMGHICPIVKKKKSAVANLTLFDFFVLFGPR